MTSIPMSTTQTKAPPALLPRLRQFFRTPNGSLTLLFLPLLAVAGTAVGWPAAAPHVLAAVAGACLTDVLVRTLKGEAGWPVSAWLSGAIVAFVLGPDTPWLVTLSIAAFASALKHVVRLPRGHVFNPAGLALLLSVPVFAPGQSWWGGLPDLHWLWLLPLLAAGVWIVDRINKLPLMLSFLGAFFGLATFASLANPASVAELFRPPFVNAAVFFAAFMITDPPTSAARLSDQLWLGPLVALVSVVSLLLGAGQSFLLIGLLAGNVALVVHRWLFRPSRRPAGATA